MSELENMLNQNRAKKLDAEIPKEAKRYKEVTGNHGVGVTGPMPVDESADETVFLRKAGFDPEQWEIDGPVQYREWDANLGGGQVETMCYRKFNAVKKSEHHVDLKHLIAILQDTPAPPETITGGDATFIPIIGDLQLGKALHDDTPVFTPKGWVKHGDIQPGDYVYSPTGEPVKVLAVTGSTEQELYRVNFDRGHSLIASGEHIWRGKRKYHPRGYKHGGPTWEWRDMQLTTEDLSKFGVTTKTNGRKHVTRPLAIDPTKPVEMLPNQLPIDPYILGLWLGDGNQHTGTIGKGRADEGWLKEIGKEIPSNSVGNHFGIRVDGLTVDLREAGLIQNKHVPQRYLMSSVDQRLALLQGLMDTDGHAMPGGGAEFSSTTKSIADAVAFILSSFGVKYRRIERIGQLNGEDKKPFSRITFSHLAGLSPFRSPRKLAAFKETELERSKLWWVGLIEPVGKGMAQCLKVEGSMYLAGEQMIPTHNSDGDGTEGIVRRFTETLHASFAEYLWRKEQHQVGPVHIPFLGDCIEGLVSQGGRNVTRNDLGLAQQVDLLDHLFTETVKLFSPHTHKLTVASVPGNHDDTTRQHGTKFDDSFAVSALNTVTRSLRLAGDRFDHVQTFAPMEDELTITMDVNGSVITHAHGHQWGKGKHWDWWKGHAFHKQSDIRQSTILLSGHSHHYRTETNGDNHYIMAPAFESRSQWWLNQTGDQGNPGLVAITTHKGVVLTQSFHKGEVNL